MASKPCNEKKKEDCDSEDSCSKKKLNDSCESDDSCEDSCCKTTSEDPYNTKKKQEKCCDSEDSCSKKKQEKCCDSEDSCSKTKIEKSNDSCESDDSCENLKTKCEDSCSTKKKQEKCCDSEGSCSKKKRDSCSDKRRAKDLNSCSKTTKKRLEKCCDSEDSCSKKKEEKCCDSEGSCSKTKIEKLNDSCESDDSCENLKTKCEDSCNTKKKSDKCCDSEGSCSKKKEEKCYDSVGSCSKKKLEDSSKSEDSCCDDCYEESDCVVEMELLVKKKLPISEVQTKTVTIAVNGLTCTDCAHAIEKNLLKSTYVIAANVTFLTHKAEIIFDPTGIDEDTIAKKIDKLGYTTEILASDLKNSARLVLQMNEMIASVARMELESAICSKPGVSKFSLSGLQLHIDYLPSVTGARKLMQEIKQLGYDVTVTSAQVFEASVASQEEVKKWRRYFWISAVLSFPILLLSFVFPASSRLDVFKTEVASGLSVKVLIEWILATPIQFWIARPFYNSAYGALRYNHSANMDTLVVISTSTAYFYSVISTILAISQVHYEGGTFFETSALLLTLIILGRYLEIAAKGRTSQTLSRLVDLQAPTAILLIHEGSAIVGEEEIDINLVQRDDLVKVVPGSKIPTDGVVVFGSTSVDESMVTGESVPVTKTIGSTVFGGTVNQNGLIHVKVSKLASESTVSNIIRLVEEAQASKPNIQRAGDRIASYFVPIIIGVAIVVFIIWIALASANKVDTALSPLPFALQFFLAVLIISCPCAIGLAVPTAVMVATGVGAEHGILIKGGAVLELCHKTDTIVFDKTGTLTHGKPTVSQCTLFSNKYDDRAMLFYVGSAEMGSEHIIAKAIVQHAQQQGEQLQEPTDFKATPGKGLSCSVSTKEVVIGNRDWMKEHDVAPTTEMNSVVSELESKGETVVWVAIDQELAGIVALADTPKPEAAQVVQKLKEFGIEVWMVSGDNRKTAEAIASQIGISKVMGEVLPGEKADKIRQLQAQGKIVTMVGDGINDAPALTQANVGIAVGAGTDVALEAASVVLVKNDLRDVLVTLDLSKVTYRRILINFAWAFLYNALGIPLAAGVLYTAKVTIHPAFAGLSELLSSVPVVLFSLLLRAYKPSF